MVQTGPCLQRPFWSVGIGFRGHAPHKTPLDKGYKHQLHSSPFAI